MTKKYDVVALGELLIDFTENGVSEQGNPLLEANPGGAPCNVLAMLNRLGRKTAFIGKVGSDIFGRQLAQAVHESGTDITNLVFDGKVHTTLAFVHTQPDGEREFSFYRSPGADMMLHKSEVMEEIIQSGKIFHFGTLSSTHPGVREATRYAIDVAKESGLLLSFDPNLREPLWDSMEDARREISYGLSKCDILKISDNELEFMTGTNDYTKGVEELRSQYDNIKVIFVTLGRDGSRAYYKDMMVEVPSFTEVKAVEKTGAGDTFEGCALHYLIEYGIDNLTWSQLTELLTFANAGASLITTRRGALKVMPTREEIEKLMRRA
jgi:fructokinase